MVLIHKTLNTDIRNYLKKYCNYEIKTTCRLHQVTVYKWIIATEPNHLNDYGANHHHVAQTRKRVLWDVFVIIFVGETEQKREIVSKTEVSFVNLFIEQL